MRFWTRVYVSKRFNVYARDAVTNYGAITLQILAVCAAAKISPEEGMEAGRRESGGVGGGPFVCRRPFDDVGG